jgi:hypothetical protein
MLHQCTSTVSMHRQPSQSDTCAASAVSCSWQTLLALHTALCPLTCSSPQANCCFTAVRRGHSSLVWLRPVLLLCIVQYCYSVWAGMVLYLAPGSLFPAVYLRSLIWCDMMAAALTGLALVMEVYQVRGCMALFVCLRGGAAMHA